MRKGGRKEEEEESLFLFILISYSRSSMNSSSVLSPMTMTSPDHPSFLPLNLFVSYFYLLTCWKGKQGRLGLPLRARLESGESLSLTRRSSSLSGMTPRVLSRRLAYVLKLATKEQKRTEVKVGRKFAPSARREGKTFRARRPMFRSLY